MKKLYGCIPLLSLLEIIPCNKLDEINRNLLKCRRKVIQIKNKNQNKLKTMKKNKHWMLLQLRQRRDQIEVIKEAPKRSWELKQTWSMVVT